MTINKNRTKWFLEIIGNAIKHPSIIFQSINSYNVRAFFRMARENGLKAVAITVARTVSNQFEDNNGVKPQNLVEVCRPLQVPRSNNPLVSIVIPVYNQYEYTIACINSVIEAVDGIDVEIIIADDNSSDETKTIDEIKDLLVIHNIKNLGFLRNCNNATKIAKGKYVLFLNNDTVVKKEWLSSLIDLIESDKSIGLVGSKFIYPDGVLQEAGGILWSDGSAWNYGRGKNPNLPEFNYVKDVDYISGASIMIPLNLFRELGGFDERYVPAYCEDSDLAFTIKKAGYRVVYQPKSEVIHFEGISNGKTVKSSIKSYQIVNTQKFKEKWNEELIANHKPNGVDLFHARDRSFNKKTILFIDATVPQFDDNAGNRTVYDYMRILVHLGYNVKLMVENFYRDPQYTPIYESMGIEVLYGPNYAAEWKSWIKSNADNIDYVMLFRAQCAEYFLEYVKENCSAKIFYNVADLHFIRKEREYKITGDKRALDESARYKKIETHYLKMADVCVTVSTDEFKIISSIVDSSKVRVFPIYCYNGIKNGKKVGNNHELMFVGSFNHPPNKDAVEWFISDILPKISLKVHDVVVNIVGSNVPEILINRSPECVVYHNHVSDDELSALYDKVRAVVIPLRYGAGVKGKTVEAIHNLVPLVSTTIGIEGIFDVDQIIKPCDDADSFADETIRLLLDDDYSNTVSSTYKKYMESHFSQKEMERLFLHEFK